MIWCTTIKVPTIQTSIIAVLIIVIYCKLITLLALFKIFYTVIILFIRTSQKKSDLTYF